MESLTLIPHPDHPPDAVRSVTAGFIGLSREWLQVRWRIEGAGQVVIPPFAGKRRRDGLWQTTCFELFVRAEQGEGYLEFNLSPSENWAAYEFSAYRAGMEDLRLGRAPGCTMRRGRDLKIFDGAIPRDPLPALWPWAVGISAVIEEEGGAKSYWALAHPPGKADFHHPACFAVTIGAPESA